MTAFGWDPSIIPDPEKRESFLRSKLNWQETAELAHAEVLDWYRKLIKLRRAEPSLNNGEPGNTAVTFNEDERWICIQRGSIIVACSIAESAQTVPIHREGELIFASRQEIATAGDTVTLPPDSIAVIRTIADR